MNDKPLDEGPLISGDALGRVVSFSDAVVAVAITVLALPLVSLGFPAGSTSPFAIITGNWAQIEAFLLTFVIVFALWQGHHRVFRNFKAIDGTIMILNGAWLLTIAFLPWPSRLISDASGGQQAAWLYCADLFLNSLLLHAITQHGRNHPELVRDDSLWQTWLTISIVFSAMFAVLTLLAFAAPQWALRLLWLVIAVRILIQQDGRLRSWFYSREPNP